ncbi:MAG: Flp pilus assembly complex ATPase component TadA [Bacteroidales bacterium]|nr:Flp pilus assembly complex ATPase component TadA [Bacteroidales bacterium]
MTHHNNHDHNHEASEHPEIIRLDHITVEFDHKVVLDDVDLSVREGDFMAISGPNGGGKTTLLRVLLQLLKPTRGRVTYLHDGVPVKRLHIGYLPQKSKIDTKFPITVRDTVLSGLRQGWFGRLPAGWEERFAKVADLCGINDYLGKSVGMLSGGQLQRTLLARAVIYDPKVLVLDEPLSYVDKQFEHRIYSIVENLARHTTILLVSHEMSVISRMANRHLIVDHKIHSCHALHHYVPGCEDNEIDR